MCVYVSYVCARISTWTPCRSQFLGFRIRRNWGGERRAYSLRMTCIIGMFNGLV